MKQFTRTLATITAIIATLCISSQVMANGIISKVADETNPVAKDITMAPIVQATTIAPFEALAVNTNISSFTIETIPTPQQGVLTINMNGTPMLIGEGMMLSPDLANSITFTPAALYTGNVVFTYSATDENSLISNVAHYTIPVIGQQVILPISLLQFSGSINNKKAELYWQTTQEGNSSYFELQRSGDGKSFETIATITAKGNINLNDYQHTDDLFFYTYQTVYYRIKMIDINGKFKYSGIVTLQPDAAIKTNIKVWPLPFSSSLNIAYSSEANETVKICIHSVNGAAVISTSNIVKKGINNITFNQAQSIPAGTYLLTISNGNKAQTIKVLKS